MPETVIALLLEARQVLNMGQGELGDLVRVSRRTVQRWDALQSTPGASDLGKVAVAVHPHDPNLAARIAARAGTTLEGLGLVQAPAVATPTPAAVAPPPVERSAESIGHMVDGVVCAAADALGVPPAGVRPVLLAAFRKAAEVELRVEDVVRALSPARARAARSKPRSARPARSPGSRVRPPAR